VVSSTHAKILGGEIFSIRGIDFFVVALFPLLACSEEKKKEEEVVVFSSPERGEKKAPFRPPKKGRVTGALLSSS